MKNFSASKDLARRLNGKRKRAAEKRTKSSLFFEKLLNEVQKRKKSNAERDN